MKQHTLLTFLFLLLLDNITAAPPAPPPPPPPLPPPSTPTWPITFSARFDEFFKGGDGQSYPGLFGLDLTWIDNTTKIHGAQIILRNDGTKDSSCYAVNPGELLLFPKMLFWSLP